jgi:hypothetical protein
LRIEYVRNVLGACVFAGLLYLGGSVAAAQSETPEKPPDAPIDRFDVLYEVGLVPSEKSAHVSIVLGAGSDAVKWIRFAFDPLRHRAITADGELEEVEGGMRWTPPPGGGTLRYVFSIDHLRDEQAYDARCAKSWAIFRGQDLVPRIRIRTTAGAESDSILQMRLPERWSAAVPYRRLTGARYDLENDRTRFDRPTGWLAFGKLGVIREELEGMRVSVVGPAGQGVRRMDALALLKWTVPSLAEVFGRLPERFQIVIAGDPMWRGGLSGPRSAYLHVDRPLISEDSTSPLLHELVHSMMRARSARDGDWIVEGIAEYYSIALLRRSGTLTAERYEGAIEKIRNSAAPASDSLRGDMTPALRARSVVLLMEMDSMILSATGGARSFDDVVRFLMKSDKTITNELLQKYVEKVAEREFSDFFEGLEK